MHKAGDLTYIAGEWLRVSKVIEHPQYGICYKFTPATDAEISKHAMRQHDEIMAKPEIKAVFKRLASR